MHTAENVLCMKYDMRLYSLELKVVDSTCNTDDLFSIVKSTKGSICDVVAGNGHEKQGMYHFYGYLKAFFVRCSIFVLKTCVCFQVMCAVYVPGKTLALRLVRLRTQKIRTPFLEWCSFSCATDVCRLFTSPR